MEILLRALTLGGVLSLAMCVVDAFDDLGANAPRRQEARRKWLNILTAVSACAFWMGLVVASVSPRLQGDAGATAVVCGLVTPGAMLARFGPIRALGYLLLLVAAPFSMAIVATWFGWDGLNMHMN